MWTFLSFGATSRAGQMKMEPHWPTGPRKQPHEDTERVGHPTQLGSTEAGQTGHTAISVLLHVPKELSAPQQLCCRLRN